MQRCPAIRNLRRSGEGVRHERLIAVLRVDQVVIRLLFVGAREVGARERSVRWRGDGEARLCLRATREALGWRIARYADLPRLAIRRFERDRVQRDGIGALIEQLYLHSKRLAGNRNRESENGTTEGIASLRLLFGQNRRNQR